MPPKRMITHSGGVYSDTVWAGIDATRDRAAIVIPVNLQGVLGAGLAKEFRSRDADAYASTTYRKACASNQYFASGTTCLLSGYYDNRLGVDMDVIFLPTKTHWKDESSWAKIEKTLPSLVDCVLCSGATHVFLPLLGAGLGGIDPADVYRKLYFAEAFDRLPNTATLHICCNDKGSISRQRADQKTLLHASAYSTFTTIKKHKKE